MWRDAEMGNSNFNNPNKYDFEYKFTVAIKVCVVLMGVLAVLRLVTLDILGTISDALGVVMIIFFLYGRNKCMAIFLMFNAVMGFIISYQKIDQISTITKLQGGYSNSDSFNLGVCIFGLVVYVYECVLSGIGIFRYDWFGNIAGSDSSSNSNEQYMSSYGAIGGNSNYNNNGNGTRTTFVAFQGRGTTVG